MRGFVSEGDTFFEQETHHRHKGNPLVSIDEGMIFRKPECATDASSAESGSACS